MCRPIRPRERDARPPTGSAHDLTLGRRRPAGAASPSRFRFARAASLLAAALALLLGAGTAQAQTAVKLVSNTGQADGGNANLAFDLAQKFTTGSSTVGYRLTRADLGFQMISGSAPTFSVSVHSDSSGAPGASLGTLTRASGSGLPSTATLIQFDASGTGIDLDASTDYWVVVDVTASSNVGAFVSTTESGDEDATPSAGWSIADARKSRAWGATSWSDATAAAKLAIYGYDRGPVTQVSNTGQTAQSGTTFIGPSFGNVWTQAQLFTAGDNTDGYTLSAVDVRLAGNTGAGNDPTKLQVSIYSVSSGAPDSSLYVLTNPASFSNDAVNTFTAPANSTLDANTTYAVVLETTDTTKKINFRRTASDDEDSGAQSGWSIADTRSSKSDASDSTWSTSAESLLIAIKGTAGTSSVAGPTITIAAGTSPVTEGTAAEFTVTASEAPSADLVVNLNVSESSDGDYVADGNVGSKTVTITATNTSATYSVTTEADTTNEANGTVTVAVAAGTGYTVGTASSADVAVNDDDDATITGVEITSSPAFGDTYRRGETIEVKVTWSEDVTWDVSATNASLQVDLAIGTVNRGATLVTDGATSGTARSLVFRYAVVQADTDTDGVVVQATSATPSILVRLVNSATLQDFTGTAASRAHAGLSADADHKVDGSVVNAAPAFASATVTREVAENTAAGGNVGAAVTATDANSDTLTYTLGGTDASSFGLDGSSGQITVGAGTTLNFEGTQTSYSVTVTASDGVEDATATVTINVTDVAEAPSAPSAPTVNATSGSNTSLDVSWSAPTDAGRPAVTDYDWRWKVQTDTTWTEKTDTTTTATSATIASLTAGTAYHVQVRATNDEGTGPWSSSGSGTTNSATNNAPTVANAIPDQAAMVGAAFSYAFPANTFNDADGDTLTYTATQSDGSALPGWLGFTDSTRAFAGTPADAGTVSVTVTASDGTASVSDGFDIVVSAAAVGPELVRNTGQTDGGDAALSNDHDQEFTTGRHPSGYKLTSIALELHLASGTAPTYTVSILDGTTSLGELTQQASLTGSPALVQFAAAGDGIDLDPDATYRVVFDVTSGANADAHVGRTTSKAQDAGGAAGFRIANSRQWRAAGDTTWEDPNTANVLKLVVHGHAKPLVGNTGQPVANSAALPTNLISADGFTTGSHIAGYTLTGVDLAWSLTNAPNTTEPDCTVSIWSSNPSGNPDRNLGELTKPSVVIDGTNRFTASGAGIELDASTTYFVMLEVRSVGDRGTQADYTTSAGEDAGAAPGWSIADDALVSTDSGATWTPSPPGYSNMFAVHAHPNPPLVANTGRDDSGNATLNNDHAQGFQTGSHADGYKLTAVELKLGSTAATAPTYTVTVRSATAGNEPDETTGGLVGTLTQQGSLASDAAYFQFTAPGGGLDLAASTDYFVLLDVTAGPSASALVRRTASDDEDPGAAAGWGIWNGRLYRSSGDSAWTQHTADVLKLAVIGKEATAQANSAPEASQPIFGGTVDVGASLEVDLATHFSDPDNDTLTYAAESSNTAAATVAVAGATLTVNGVAAGTATITVTASDPDGESAMQTFAVTVTDTPPVGGGTPQGPERLAAMVRDATLTLVYESDLDTASTPAPGAFAATVNGAARALAAEDLNAVPPVKPVEVKDRRVVLTLSSAVGATDAVRLTYTVPGANPIQDAAGEAAAGFENLGVSNLAGDARSPVLRSATVEGNLLTLVYDELLNPDARATPNSFAVREVHDNGEDRITVDNVKVAGKRVVLTLQRDVDPDRKVELTYNSSGDDTPDSPAIIQDFAGNVAGGIWTPLAVVHGPPPAESARPPSSGGGPSGGGGGGAEPRNAAPEASDPIGALTLGAGGSVGVDLSAHFTDPDGDELDFAAESSDPAVAAVEVDGATLTVRGLAPGSAEATVTAEDPDGETAVQRFAVTVTGVETVWHLPPASDPVLQGFVRIINHSDHAGKATVTATDDAGRVYEPLTLALDRRGAAHFNVHDLEMGNPDKGLTGATGPGTGGWRLAVWSDALAVEALAYARAADGFLTPLDGTAPRSADGALALATFNPGSNWRQVSLLRLVNPTTEDAEAMVTGVDDPGRSPGQPVRLTVPAGTACTVDAAELESGSGLACGDPQAGLGDGEGKWRLRIESDAPLTAQGLLRSPTGHLSNLSGGALPADADGVRRVLTFPSAADPDGRQGFVRFINRSDRDGTVTVRAADGTDADYEALTLALKAGQAAQFNSDDLELGNPDKGLTGSTGPGRGDWTLALSADGIDFDAFAYVRSRRDGFLAPMGAAAPSRDVDGASVSRVAFLNPGSNWRQRSLLRLVNPGDVDAAVSIEGTDDTGLRPGSPVRLTVPAGGAIDLTSAELESGDAESIESGALGDGKGKWRLRIESDGPVAAQSLATSPTGRLVNLSGADGSRGFRHGLLPPPGRVTLESPYECELLGRWDAPRGAPHAVDLLRDGERDAALSAERWTQPTRRWAGLCEGTYAIRVCALNADGDCGPWSEESNAVTVD